MKVKTVSRMHKTFKDSKLKKTNEQGKRHRKAVAETKPKSNKKISIYLYQSSWL